jgi:hypothetical protein
MTPMRVTDAERETILAQRAQAALLATQQQRDTVTGFPPVPPQRPTKTPSIHARTEWCPNCNPPEKLVRRDLNEVYAEKGCFRCRSKFRFTRTDTSAGRRQRAVEWRASKTPADRKQIEPEVIK